MRVPGPIGVGIFSLAVVLVGLNAALLRQNKMLAALDKAYQSSSHLNAGDGVPVLTGIGDTGQSITVDYPSGRQKTLLLVFSPSCVECTLNWPNWHKLLGHIDGERTRILGVTFEDRGLSRSYICQVGLPQVQQVLMPNPESVILYRFRLTPQTILIGPSRKVEGIWSGILGANELAEVERLASGAATALPGNLNPISTLKTPQPNR